MRPKSVVIWTLTSTEGGTHVGMEQTGFPSEETASSRMRTTAGRSSWAAWRGSLGGWTDYERRHRALIFRGIHAGSTWFSAFRYSVIFIVRLRKAQITPELLGSLSFLCLSFRDCGCGKAMAFDNSFR